MEDYNFIYTKADVETALRFLRLHFPNYATPENAMKVLIYCRDKARAVEDLSATEVENYLIDSEDH